MAVTFLPIDHHSLSLVLAVTSPKHNSYLLPRLPSLPLFSGFVWLPVALPCGYLPAVCVFSPVGWSNFARPHKKGLCWFKTGFVCTTTYKHWQGYVEVALSTGWAPGLVPSWPFRDPCSSRAWGLPARTALQWPSLVTAWAVEGLEMPLGALPVLTLRVVRIFWSFVIFFELPRSPSWSSSAHHHPLMA